MYSGGELGISVPEKYKEHVGKDWVRWIVEFLWTCQTSGVVLDVIHIGNVGAANRYSEVYGGNPRAGGEHKFCPLEE